MQKQKTQNQSLIPYLVAPAFEQSKSSLQGVQEYVEEYKFLSNWINIEHEGWILPSTTEKLPRKDCWIKNRITA